MIEQVIKTSESVTEGHPDKVCDLISDSILDAYLEQDPSSRVACEVMCKDKTVIVAGEITSHGKVDHEEVVRKAITEVGYTDASEPFNAKGVEVVQLISKQVPEICVAVDREGAGDQGIMFGYATDETPELMPLPALLSHRLAKGLADDRKTGKALWLRPDGKTQVSVAYENGQPVAVTDVVVSTQHLQGVKQQAILDYVVNELAPRVLETWFTKSIRFIVNPSGSFVQGGPSADCGVTGRKIIVDTYGGACPHGGGAFSGKDPSKVDRSAAYFCRYVAREIVKAKLAKKVFVHVAYAIGMAKPVSIMADTLGTGDDVAATEFINKFDFRPKAIIERLGLLRPIYRTTTNYGHFGRPELSWEK